jgi:hypothetical protein
VGYEETAHADIFPQRDEQRYYPVPAFRVKAGHGFIADKVLWVYRQSPGDYYLLPLTAGKFVRAAVRFTADSK